MIAPEQVRLDEISRQITDGKHGDCEDQPNSGFYFLSCKDIRDGKMQYDNARQITEADFHDTHRRTLLEPSDILITNSGTIGRMALAPRSELTERTTFQKSVAIVKPNPQRVSPRFLYYLLSGEMERLVALAGGTAQKNLLLRDLRSFAITLPIRRVQEKISLILSAYDDLIENNTRRIKILEEMAQSLYREWFVHFRFPGHENVPTVDSVLGRIPQGWVVSHMAAFGAVVTGKTPPKGRRDFFGSDIPFIKLPDMHGNLFILETTEGLSLAGESSQKNKTLPPNSLSVSCIGTAGIVAITTCPSQTNQQINSVILESPLNRELLYFRLIDLRETINLYGANGATMVNLNKTKFENLPVLKPSDKLISYFHTNVGPLFDQIKSLQKKNRNLRATRDLLLPKLISGEILIEAADYEASKSLEQVA